MILISQGWSGRASDKTITLSSQDLIKWLAPGDTVMSNKGFLVGSDLASRNIKLVMPSFKGSDRSQFTSMEIECSEKILKAQVHVGRVIQHIKTFKILHGVMKLSMLDILKSIFTVCAYLVNLQPTVMNYA